VTALWEVLQPPIRATPYCGGWIAEVTKGTRRECLLLCFELLEADDLGLRLREPRHEIV
jgi:hypothetical protein